MHVTLDNKHGYGEEQASHYRVALHIDCTYPQECICKSHESPPTAPYVVELYANNERKAILAALSIAHATNELICDFHDKDIDPMDCDWLPDNEAIYYEYADDGWDGFAIHIKRLDT